MLMRELSACTDERDDVTDAMATYPSGTVTFLFTDIEGSTERWERHPAAMQEAVRRHDALLRSTIKSHGGHVFKTVGDAFYGAFALAPDALTAALAAQRALALEDFTAVDGLRVRMALHTGSADQREGDYFGSALNRVARLLAIGHGGQSLVSGTIASWCKDNFRRRPRCANWARMSLNI